MTSFPLKSWLDEWIGYYYFCYKISDKNTIKKEGFFWTGNLRVYSVIVEKAGRSMRLLVMLYLKSGSREERMLTYRSLSPFYTSSIQTME